MVMVCGHDLSALAQRHLGSGQHFAQQAELCRYCRRDVQLLQHLFDVLRPDSYDTMTFYIKALRDGSFVWHVWEIE